MEWRKVVEKAKTSTKGSLAPDDDDDDDDE
jgi:hypothetical protein